MKHNSYKHGHAYRIGRTQTYRSWEAMLQRCLNPHCVSYHRYGGRGISVCERWMKFSNFLEDMGECPSGLTLERINNKTGHYAKLNCVWATRKVQARNRSSNHMIAFRGQIKPLMEWSEVTGIHRKTIENRILLGWDIEKALTRPARRLSK